MKNIYEIIGKIIIAQNAQKFSRKEVVENTVSEHVRISIYRQIVGIVVSLNMNKDVELQQRITTLHATIVEHFQDNLEGFAILMNAFHQKGRDEEYAETMGNFIKHFFLTEIIGDEILSFEEEIVFITQVFMLIELTTERDFIQHITDELFKTYEEEELSACDGIYQTLMYVLSEQEGQDEHSMDLFMDSEDPNEVISGEIFQYASNKSRMGIIHAIQRLSMYVALHTDEVDILSSLQNNQFNIQPSIGAFFTDHYEDIFAECEKIINEFPKHPEGAQRILSQLKYHPESKVHIPKLKNPIEYISFLMEVFHMLCIMCRIRQREDIIQRLKETFSAEEQEIFSAFITETNRKTRTSDKEAE